MKSFIVHRNAFATEKSVAKPLLAPVLGCSQQALLRFRAVSQNNIKTKYYEQSHLSIHQ